MSLRRIETLHRPPAAVAIALCFGLAGASFAGAQTPTLRTRSVGGVDARGAALLLSGELGGDLGGAAVWAVPRRAAPGESVPIEVVLELEGGGLVDVETGSRGTVDIYAYLIDEDGTVVDHLAEELAVDDPATAAAIARSGLVFAGEMRAGAGRYSLRLAARTRLTHRFFLEKQDIEVPAVDGSRTVVLPPLVPAVRQRVMAVPRGLDLDGVVERNPALVPWPSAQPVVAPGATMSVAVTHSPLASGQTLGLRLGGPGGSELLINDAVGQQRAESPDRLSVTRTSIPVPGLAPGEYRLTAFVTDGGEVAASSATRVVVHPDAVEMSWDDPDAPRGGSSRPLPLQPDSGAHSAVAVNQTAVSEDAELAAVEDPAAQQPVPEPLCAGEHPGPELVETRPLRGIEARAAALLLTGQSGGEVAGEVVWTSLGAAAAGETAELPLVVEVDGRQLLADSVELPVVVEIYGYVLDGSGSVAGHIAEGLALDDCALIARLRESGLKFIGRLSAAPGPYSVRVIVRNRDTHRFFLARRDLEVPAVGSERPLVLPPLIADQSPGWLVAGQQGIDLEALRNRLPGLPSWPSALPTWPSSRPLELAVGVLDPTGTRELAARLADSDGVPVPEPDLTVAADVVESGGLEVRTVSIAAPDLPPGSYRLMVVLSDRDSGESAVRSLPVVIHDGSEPLSWTDPEAPRNAGPAPPPVRSEATALADVEDSVLRAAYRQVLRLWADGEVVAARRELAGLERKAAGPPTARSWRRLFNAEHLTVLELADREPAALLAIAVLHRDMHAWYSARRETDLAEHSWQIAAVIVRTAQAEDDWQPPEGFGECVLLDLASRLAAQGLWRGTERALEVALDLAPDSAPALLGLGALHERSGDLDAAKWPLQKLVRAHPEEFEGRLRLAVNRARLGSERDAEELFRDLLAGTTPEWIRAVAYQELATLLIGEGRGGEAASLLEEGASRIPGNRRLLILLVHAYDVAGRPRESAAATARLGGAVSQQSTSPRYLYSRFPDLAGDRVRDTLAAAGEVGRAGLQKALREAPQEAPGEARQ